jgi:hypothetical protein
MGIAAKTPDLAMLTSANVGAINFNGSTSYIEYTNNAFGNFGSALTISFWIKPEYLSTVFFPVIIGVPTGGSNTGTQFITLRRHDSSAYGFFANFEGSGDSGADFTVLGSSANIVVGQWNHVMFAFNGTTAKTMNVNGVTKSVTAAYNDSTYFYSNTTSDTWLGGSQGTGTNIVNNFKGDLAEIWIDDSYLNVTDSSVISQFKSASNKPVITLPSSKIHFSGDSTTWSNKGSTDMGTQTLNNITTATSSPSD